MRQTSGCSSYLNEFGWENDAGAHIHRVYINSAGKLPSGPFKHEILIEDETVTTLGDALS